MENSQQLTPHCAYNKTVYQVYFSLKCKQVCFICCDNKCECKALHKKCDKVDWDYIYENLDKNIIKNTPEFKSLSNQLDQLYQTTIKDITKSYDDFKIWRDDFGLTETQSSFLHLIEQGRFTELTSAKMYEIRKQIKTPSNIILKSQIQLKEEVCMINNYTVKLVQQMKGLYDQNKVIKEQLVEQIFEKNNKYKIQVVEHIQAKGNLAHKLLGLNDKGSRFFTMINEGVIDKQLQKILEKINLNEESINENKLAINQNKILINQTINKIKQAIELRIQNLTEAVIENTQNLNKETNSKLRIMKKQINSHLRISNINIDLKFKKFIKDHSQYKLSTEELNQALVKLEQKAENSANQILLKIKKIKDQGLFNFFAKKIKKKNLLYRASQNNFQGSNIIIQQNIQIFSAPLYLMIKSLLEFIFYPTMIKYQNVGIFNYNDQQYRVIKFIQLVLQK